jgi:hypothetical protein
MNKDWSDDEDNNDIDNNVELVQPSRDFPISDEENDEEDEYDMYELSKLIINKNTSDDLFQIKSDKSDKSDKSENKKENVKKDIKIEKANNFLWNKEVKKIEVRKFNPRLPPPSKYNKNNKSYLNFNLKDFPSL